MSCQTLAYVVSGPSNLTFTEKDVRNYITHKFCAAGVILTERVVEKKYGSFSFLRDDTCARGQNGDFTLPEGTITRARAKKFKENFGNLAILIHEEMHQSLAKEEKINHIGLNVKKPKSCLQVHWTE
ncbi:hypothetical protein PIB30_004499 [Stylosanthes scabra]|uniref:Uncharacterized protein n=1 Tax=Stylosanthes scabra TaxID=79078 RepID=A0ABU6X5F0_9FABA|nr:hypothetical protein [Stylosanthes scabra]